MHLAFGKSAVLIQASNVKYSLAPFRCTGSRQPLLRRSTDSTPGIREGQQRCTAAHHSGRPSRVSLSQERVMLKERRLFLVGGLVAGISIIQGGASIAKVDTTAPETEYDLPYRDAGLTATALADKTEEEKTAGGAVAKPEGNTPVPDAAKGEGTDADEEVGATKKKKSTEEYEEEAERILEEEDAAKQRPDEKKRRKNKLQELQEVRDALRSKQVEIIKRGDELMEKEQTLAVLREELELERSLRELLTKEKEKAEEQAKLALGLCGQNYLIP